jgi:hypothetical protein
VDPLSEFNQLKHSCLTGACRYTYYKHNLQFIHQPY